ncbi:hypothetical protein JL721_2188 [Aureococcus anophagefferens]|nr:hypothetical protein JL721_2188 [Aureococcus anophagefferens]
MASRAALAALAALAAITAAETDVAFYVLSTAQTKRVNKTHAEPLHWIRQRALPALATWGRHFDAVYFVVEASFADSDDGRRCEPGATGQELTCADLGGATFLLSNCTNEYRGAGPCCKCDVGLAHAARTGNARWAAFADDDVFFDASSLRASLEPLDATKAFAVVPSGARNRPPFKASVACRSVMRQSYWAQPAILSRGALALARAGLERRGVSEECALFSVSHEGGLGVFLWSLGIEPLGMPEPDFYVRDARRLPGLPTADEGPQPARKVNARPVRGPRRPHGPLKPLASAPIAVHRVGRGNDYPSFEAVEALREGARRGGARWPPRGGARWRRGGGTRTAFRPEDCEACGAVCVA